MPQGYQRTIGDIPAAEFWAAIERIIEEKMEATFLKYLPDLQGFVNSVKSKGELLSTRDTCKNLKVSRQTLNNWFSKQGTKRLLEGVRVKRGRNNFFRYNELVAIVDNNPDVFSKGMELKYKDTLSAALVHNISITTENILGAEISENLTQFEVFKKVKQGYPISEPEKRSLD